MNSSRPHLPETMLAAVYRGKENVVIETVPVPEIGAGELLLRVKACGVCGTDLKKIHYGLVPPPRIFGHETIGEIVRIGEGVTEWKPGQRVMVNHHVPCLREDCFYCKRKAFSQCPTYKKTGTTAGFEPAGGGFAEYARVMDWCVERGTVLIPDEISDEEATFVEPLNTCLKGIELAHLQKEDTVVILGQGPIGLLFTRLATLAGARVIAIDKIEARRDMALQFGATEALSPEDDLNAEVRRLSDGRGADLVIVAVAISSVIAPAFALVRPAGKILLFAQTRLEDLITVDVGQICMLEKSLLGSYSSDITLQEKAAELIFTRKVDVRPLLTHRFPLTQIAEAFALASHPTSHSLKVVVNP